MRGGGGVEGPVKIEKCGDVRGERGAEEEDAVCEGASAAGAETGSGSGYR